MYICWRMDWCRVRHRFLGNNNLVLGTLKLIFPGEPGKGTDMTNAVKSVSTIRNFMGNAGRNTCNEALYEALKDADEALQRQVPQKTKDETFDKDMRIGPVVFKAGTKVHHCPVCNTMVTGSNNFCNRCGQALI